MSKMDLLQGALDVMVLQTLATMGALHGYGIAWRTEQVSGDEVLPNQGTIHASLVRMQRRGWIVPNEALRRITGRRRSTRLRGRARNNWPPMPPTGSG
ncbi:MAG: PadR family transcriptional regulator [Bryobacteraceae bacterium]